MKTTFALLVIALFTTAVFASEPTTAKVTAVKKYEHGRIAYWEGSVPIYDGNPVYDMTIQVGAKKYLVRYESLTGYYPSGWKIGNEIQVKKEKGRFLLMNGEESVPARIASENDCVPSNGRPTVWTVGSEVPCE